MDSEEPFKRGYLLTPPQGKLLKRSWQKKYYAIYKASNLGVERVEVFDSELLFNRHQSPSKLIPLNDCIKVVQVKTTQKNMNYVFEVICRNQIHQFSAQTNEGLTEWIAAFQTVAFGSQRVSHKFSTQLPTNQQSTKDCDKLQEENMIYSSMSKPEIYTIQVVESEASKRCNLNGTYQFVVTPLHVSISPMTNTNKPSKPFYTWHYRHIRRFSQTKETFSFEAGRKCASGEGIFTLETKEGNAIFQSVGVYLKSYKKQGPGASSQSTSDHNESDSATTFTTNSVSSSSSLESQTTAISSKLPTTTNEECLYENTVAGINNSRLPITKPPRKNICSSSISSTVSSELTTTTNCESMGMLIQTLGIDDPTCSGSSKNELLYDVPEDRVDAWKTHGLNDNIHTESVSLNDDNGPLYASVDVTAMPLPKVATLKRFMSAPEVLAEVKDRVYFRQTSMFGTQPQDGDSYDRLFSRQHSATPADPEHIYKKLELSVTSKSLKMGDSAAESVSGIGKDTSEVEHVVQNNQMYSVVNKGSKKV